MVNKPDRVNEEYRPTEADLWALWDAVHDGPNFRYAGLGYLTTLINYLRTIRAEDDPTRSDGDDGR